MFKFIEDCAIHLGITTFEVIARANMAHFGYHSPRLVTEAWNELHLRGTVPDWVSHFAARTLNRPVPRKELVF